MYRIYHKIMSLAVNFHLAGKVFLFAGVVPEVQPLRRGRPLRGSRRLPQGTSLPTLFDHFVGAAEERLRYGEPHKKGPARRQ